MAGVRIFIKMKSFTDLIRLSVFTSMIFDITPHIFYITDKKMAFVRILFYSFPYPPMQVIFYSENVQPKEKYVEYSFERKETWTWVHAGAIRDPSKKYVAVYSLVSAEDILQAKHEKNVFNVPLCRLKDFVEIAKFASFSKDIIFASRKNNRWIFFSGMFASPFLLSGTRNSIAPFLYIEGPEPRCEGILAPFVKFDDDKNKAEFLLGVSAKEYFAPIIYIEDIPLKIELATSE